MIPLRDDVPSRTVPFVNYGLIAANVAMYVVEVGMGAQLEGFFQRAAVIPALYTGSDGALSASELIRTSLDPGLAGRVVTAMFLHGGIAHLLGNMLYLWIFGDNVEDRMGHLRYLAFYLICGWVASYAHVWASPASTLPALGASGAIGGVLGAYITLYPHARVVTLIPLGIFIQLLSIPAVFLLGFWFLQQFILGTTSLGAPESQGGGVAWWAHIGGFAAGFVLVWLFQKRDRRPASRDAWWQEKRWRETPGRHRGW